VSEQVLSAERILWLMGVCVRACSSRVLVLEVKWNAGFKQTNTMHLLRERKFSSTLLPTRRTEPVAQAPSHARQCKEEEMPRPLVVFCPKSPIILHLPKSHILEFLILKHTAQWRLGRLCCIYKPKSKHLCCSIGQANGTLAIDRLWVEVMPVRPQFALRGLESREAEDPALRKPA
jgi:hypothetical protein